MGSENVDWKLVPYIAPGGSMVATAEDTAAFVWALIDGTLFTPRQQELYSSVYAYEHTGLLPGYQSIVRYHADIDAVVVLFTNESGADRWQRSADIYDRIVRILRNQSAVLGIWGKRAKAVRTL